MNRSWKIFVAFLVGFCMQSFSALHGQDVDYGNLSLGIYGAPGNNAPELLFATRLGAGPDDARFYRLEADTKALQMKTNASAAPVFAMFHAARGASLTLDPVGVGFGTYEPEESIHVYSNDRTDIGFAEARILVENDKKLTNARTMLELVNNGPARIELNNSSSNQTWALHSNNSDAFLINRLGSGGHEFSIRENGMVTMGPAGSMNFTLYPNGNLNLAGTLTQLSDRNAKEHFKAVDSESVLVKVLRLPLSSWNYKDDPTTVRHIGPMAQDFRAIFGLGQNDTSIASVDTAGVTLAAIQGLNTRLENQLRKKNEQIEDLQQQLDEIRSMLSAN